ncbi:MAG: T9SS type A sorting domain-containing protein, partial [Algoriella sp.]
IYFASGINIIKFDATTEKFDEAFAKVPGQDTTPKQTIYGAGLRIDPVSDNLILTTVGAGWGTNSEQNWAHKITNKGELINTVKLSAYYWFPALPVFQDNSAPKINGLDTTYHINSVTTLDLKDKVSDTDNLALAIVKDLEIIENDGVADFSVNDKDELVINPLKNGTAKIKISFNSNGKIVDQLITISTAVLGTNELTKSAVNIYPNPVNNILFVEVKEAAKAEIYTITGTKITEKTLQKGKNQLEVSDLQKGVYIIKVNNSTFKIIKK